MKLFSCPHCQQPLYFENYFCGNCGTPTGFDPASMEFQLAEIPANGQAFNSPSTLQYCSNRAYDVCNWLVPVDEPTGLCVACRLNRVIPDLNNTMYRVRWTNLELAKHRLVYSSLRLGLLVVSKLTNEQEGLLFDFKADGKKKRVLTGHDNGIITINIAEADDIEREMARRNMDEVYRTLLGHFRHETGHYYWDRLIMNTYNQNAFRNIFGDETMNYSDALEKHYQQGPPENWRENYISAYAAAHPWEDWAETWSHYLHIIDTLETAYYFGLNLSPFTITGNNALQLSITENPYDTKDFQRVIDGWFPLTIALNSLNRSMGHSDAYPFVIPQPVIHKLAFIHQVIQQQ